jgi:hypothetical protein
VCRKTGSRRYDGEMTHLVPALVLSITTALVLVPAAWAQEAKPQPPTVQIPDPGVLEAMTIEGSFVRGAYNNEAYAILGYRLANSSVGEEWMLLEFGTTVLDKTPAYTLKREHLSLETPDGKTHPLPSVEEYRAASEPRGLINREKVIRDSINYFPPRASQACRIGFFADLDQRALPWDQVEVSNTRACLGRLFFKVPGGITHGQHWLNVKFENSVIRVPFRILTKDEEKLLNKNFKSIKKQVDEAFRPKKK